MKTKFFLLIVFILALVLRLWSLNNFPAGLNADEAAIGYNAYSLLKTGKDEFGHLWPINFQSFNDYKPGLYFYLVLPSVAIFGLNEWAVRFPSAILGTLTVVLVYFLAKQLFEKEKNNSLLALITVFLLAISPWHLHFSRGGWETNAATFFLVLGVYLFFLSFKKGIFLSLSAVSFVLSMLTYHSARVVAPLLVLGLVIFFRKNVFSLVNRKSLITAIFIGGIPFVILLLSMRGQAGVSRFAGVGIFADKGPLWRTNELRGQHSNPSSFFVKVIHNQYLEYGIQFLNNYLKHFSGNFLFISGDEIQRNKVPGMGQFLLAEIPFLVLGLFFLIKRKPIGWNVILYWLFVAPVASALTFQAPNAIRSLNMVVPLIIIMGYGLYRGFEWLKIRIPLVLYKSTIIFVILTLAWNFSYYLHQYYVHYPQVYPSAWEDGFRDLGKYLSLNQDKYGKIYITGKYDQPYILLAFFLKYPPNVFQKEAILTPRDQYGFSTVTQFGKYYFGEFDWAKIKVEPNALIVGTPEEIPNSAKIVERIYFKDGKTEAFRIAED